MGCLAVGLTGGGGGWLLQCGLRGVLRSSGSTLEWGCVRGRCLRETGLFSPLSNCSPPGSMPEVVVGCGFFSSRIGPVVCVRLVFSGMRGFFLDGGEGHCFMQQAGVG